MAADAFDEARDELYRLDPEAFMPRRGELVAAAKRAGEDAAAKRIGALRKPTRSAYAVNQLVRAQPDTAERLARMGDELRDAQAALDGSRMRELSAQRNKVVDELTRAALKAAGSGANAAAALRDEIAGTINAAIADPEILQRLDSGALVRAEQWAGLGVADAPRLTVVRDGARASKAADRARERQAERVAKAERDVAEAEERVAEASDAVSEQRRAVRRLEDQLTEARRRVDQAENELKQARTHADKTRRALDRLR